MRPSRADRRGFLAATAALSAAPLASRLGAAQQRPDASAGPLGDGAPRGRGRAVTGALSGRVFELPEAPPAPMPVLAPPGVVHNGRPAAGFSIDPTRSHPDVRSYQRKFGLLLPATNTSMEHELWSVLVSNRAAGGLDGVGLHTTPVVTPRPQLRSPADLRAYREQFLSGLRGAVDTALLARPDYLLMGMSLEHILRGIDAIREVTREVEERSGLAWATWHDAAPAALRRFGARRIGLLTPFDRTGNENAARMFEDLGFEVVSTVGFSCAHAQHIAHIPDEAKARAITELLATPRNRLDAVVQCGTNMSLLAVTEALEPRVGVPILGINAVTLWYALRENGLRQPLLGAGRLLREA